MPTAGRAIFGPPVVDDAAGGPVVGGDGDESVADLGQDVPVPRGVPWFPADVEQWPDPWFEPWAPAAPVGCGLRPSEVVLHRPDMVEALLRTGPTLEAWPPIPC